MSTIDDTGTHWFILFSGNNMWLHHKLHGPHCRQFSYAVRSRSLVSGIYICKSKDFLHIVHKSCIFSLEESPSSIVHVIKSFSFLYISKFGFRCNMERDQWHTLSRFGQCTRKCPLLVSILDNRFNIETFESFDILIEFDITTGIKKFSFDKTFVLDITYDMV